MLSPISLIFVPIRVRLSRPAQFIDSWRVTNPTWFNPILASSAKERGFGDGWCDVETSRFYQERSSYGDRD